MNYSILLLSAVVALMFAVSPAFAQVDPDAVLVTHTISSNGQDYLISSDYQTEFSKMTGMFRIHGHVTTGEPYAIFLKQFDPDFKKVFFLKDGAFQKATLKQIIITEIPEPTQNTIPTNTLKLDFNYFISSPILIQRDFTIKLDAFDIQKSTSTYQNQGKLKNVKFHIDLEQERKEFVVVNERTSYERIVENDWKNIKTIDGVTNAYGTWSGSVLLTSGSLNADQWIRVKMTATLGDQVVIKETKVFPTVQHQ